MKKLYVLLMPIMAGCIQGNATCLSLSALHGVNASAPGNMEILTYHFYASKGQWEKGKSIIILSGLETDVVVESREGSPKSVLVCPDGRKVFTYDSGFVPFRQYQLLYHNFIPPPEI